MWRHPLSQHLKANGVVQGRRSLRTADLRPVESPGAGAACYPATSHLSQGLVPSSGWGETWAGGFPAEGLPVGRPQLPLPGLHGLPLPEPRAFLEVT